MYLFNIAEQYGDHIALEVGDKKLTFDQLLKKSDAFASSLLEHKSSLMGERVISIIKPSFDYVILQWAVWKVGGIFVPLPEKLTDSDLSFYFNDIDPSLIIIDKKLKSVVSPLAKDYDLKIDMWLNSDGDQLKYLFSNISKLELSNDAAELMNILLLTNNPPRACAQSL